MKLSVPFTMFYLHHWYLLTVSNLEVILNPFSYWPLQSIHPSPSLLPESHKVCSRDLKDQWVNVQVPESEGLGSNFCFAIPKACAPGHVI